MKQIRSVALAAVLVGMLSAIPSAVAAENYVVDSAHTYILFRVTHLNVGHSYGRLNGATGAFLLDDTSPANSRIEMQVMAKDVDTYDAKRDKHLQSPDFFDVEQHPLITFKSTSVKQLETDLYEITGDLTLLGKTRPIKIRARQTGSGKDPWGNYRRGFETKFTIKRSEFGMDFLLDAVSDEVELTVSVEGIRQ
jgi:polyisoprenoid-binding protein YceI